MKDITGREIKIGDILAVGQRSGNSGALDVRVVAGFKEGKDWNDNPFPKIKTTAGSYLERPEKTIIVPFEIFIGTEMEKIVSAELNKIAL